MMRENELNPHDDFNRPVDTGVAGPPPRDQLDSLLRRWHAENTEQARFGRDRLLLRLAHERATLSPETVPLPPHASGRTHSISRTTRGIISSPHLRAAASLLLVVTLLTMLMPLSSSRRADAKELLLPEGGRLEAFDDAGNLIGPCPLKHTDVDVDISGRFTHVTLTQRFQNTYGTKVEAVYAFPLSHRAAVDRMTITVGDRVVVGEVKERQKARQIYEAARAQGYVAGLLEQERPNIFTQSVANIEPGAEVLVEISYVELVQVSNGVYRFDFPMVVAPRYIPGSPTVSHALVPAELNPRRGVLLQGPATMRGLRLDDPDPEQFQAIDEALAKLPEGALTPLELPDGTIIPVLSGAQIQSLLHTATPIEFPGPAWWGEGENAVLPDIWAVFEAVYCGGERETGFIYDDGTGKIGNRWFFTDLKVSEEAGTGFAADTNEVPDASRITPMPVRPDRRAGHDISIAVSIDTGGPAILDIACESHEISQAGDARLKDRGKVAQLAMKNRNEIPNKDFLLSWRVEGDAIEEAHFAHRSDGDAFGDYAGGFFTLMLEPPARVDDAIVPERELIFVLDCSGSMKDQPIEKAKSLMLAAIDTMRPADTFSVVTFNNDSQVLWDASRRATPNNIAEAKRHIDSRQGGGGTEMLTAVGAALAPRVGAEQQLLTPRELADLPADGRAVEVLVAEEKLEVLLQDGVAPGLWEIRLRDDLGIRVEVHHWMLHLGAFTLEEPFGSRDMYLQGQWVTRDGERLLVVDHATDQVPGRAGAARYVFFLTDGEVGNDFAVVEAVREHATRACVFTVGIGSSPNRYLLDAMAKAGRGKSDYVSLAGDADAAVQRFVQRIERPVLTNIELSFDGVEIIDAIPPLDRVPDLFDEEPLIIHGRYEKPGKGTLTIRGTTGQGRFERCVDVTLPEKAAEHDVIATLWARSKVDAVMEEGGERGEIVKLGETFRIMTQHTSFVAVEKSRMTIGGEPMLVTIPIEMPEGQSWSGTFGGADPAAVERLASQMASRLLAYRDADAAASAATSRDREGATLAPAMPTDQEVPVAVAEAPHDATPQPQALWDGPSASPSSIGAEAQRAVEQAQQLLDQGDYAAAQRVALTGQIRLRRDRAAVSAQQFEALSEHLEEQLGRIEKAREASRLERENERRESPSMHRRAEGEDELRRKQDIEAKLREARQQQMERNYEDALQTLQEVLFLDEHNPAALVLRDVITTSEHYRAYAERGLTREFLYSRASLENQFRAIAPQPYLVGSELRGISELKQYHVHVDPLFHLSDFFNPDGTLKEPLVFGSAFGQQFGMPGYGDTRSLADSEPVDSRQTDDAGAVLGMHFSPEQRAAAAEYYKLGGDPTDGANPQYSFLRGQGYRGSYPSSAPQLGPRAAVGHDLWSRDTDQMGNGVGSGSDVGRGIARLPIAGRSGSNRPGIEDLNGGADSGPPAFTDLTLGEVLASVDPTGVGGWDDGPGAPLLGLSVSADELAAMSEFVARRKVSGKATEDLKPADEGVISFPWQRGSLVEPQESAPQLDEVLRSILEDESLDETERAAKLQEEIEQRITNAIVLRQVLSRLRAVIEESLLSFAFIADAPKEFDENYEGPKPESWADGGVRVSILLVDTKQVTLGRLRDLGVQIEGRSDSLPLIVARAPLGRLVELALQPSVRRIEPAGVTSAK